MKRSFNPIIVAIILMLSIAAPVAAGPLEDGQAAYNSGNYATALRLLRPLADQGNAIAQTGLGVMYLGGTGVPQNDTEAAKWFGLAAEQGVPGAQSVLGFMYLNGRGVPQNDAEAVRWLRSAADQGIARAQFLLGDMYSLGHGVPQDYVLAHMWCNLSAGQGEEAAALVRDELAKHMTPEQIAEAQKLAREWKPTKQPTK